jgi:beta-lactamase superfamily II metal-dependent hydrolase
MIFLTPPSEPKMVVLNVGQGDSILVQEGYFQMLVDTGPDDSLLYELPKYMPENDRTIELIILTHSHTDHIQGLFSLIGNYKIEKIIYQSNCFNASDFEYIKANYSSILYDIQMPITLHYGDIAATVVYPFNVDCHSDINQDSLVIDLTIYQTKIMLMGDAGKQAETYMMEHNLVHSVDILKTGHHCSSSATGEMFLKTLSPAVAVCSCGEGNSFGHPHSETLQTFRDQNVQYLITYEKGNIVFRIKKVR